MVTNKRSKLVFRALNYESSILSMEIKFYKNRNICSFFSFFFFCITFFITIVGCTATEETSETVPEIPI